MTKNGLIRRLNSSVDSFVATFQNAGDEKIFQKTGDKWSPAEHLQHLILSVKPLIPAYTIPAFVLQIRFGRANRPSRSYDELLTKYNSKLAAGGRAPAPFVPKPIKTGSNKTKLIENFKSVHQKLIHRAGTWSETKLDQSILPHPLLGRITMREMLYFTDFHIRHHEKAIKN